MQRDSRWFGVEPRLVISVGVVAIQWARIEWALQKIAIGVLGSDVARSVVLTTNLGFRALEQYLSALLHTTPTHGPEFVHDLSTLLGEARRLHEIANTLIGNTWPDALSERDFIGQTVALKEGKILFEEVWTDKQINIVIDDLIDLMEALQGLGAQYRLFDPIEAWKKNESSRNKGSERVLARLSVRSPATLDVLSRLKNQRQDRRQPAAQPRQRTSR